MTNLREVTRTGRPVAAWLAASVAIAGVLIVPAVAQANNPGAIWTTTSTCGPVNVNNYTSKLDVYLNGGPDGRGANGLPDGNYWVEVIVPGGEVLGKSTSAVIEVRDGRMVQCYQLWAITKQPPTFTEVGYLDTTNPGGSYNVLISQDQHFVGGTTKNDHFKVNAPTTTTTTSSTSSSTSTTTTTASTSSSTSTTSAITSSSTSSSGTATTRTQSTSTATSHVTTTPATTATGETSVTSSGTTAVVSGITGGPTTSVGVEALTGLLPPTSTGSDGHDGAAGVSLVLLLLAGALLTVSAAWPVSARMRR